MSLLLLLLRLHLALVMAVAVAGKLMDLAGARVALEAFGCPPKLVPAALPLLLLTEGAVAICLPFVSTSRSGALAGFALFLLFSGAMVRLLRQGKRPHCHCFGALHSAPISSAAVLRNLGLMLCFLPMLGSADQGRELSSLSDPEALILALNAALYAVAGVGLWQVRRLLNLQATLQIRVEELRSQLPGAPTAAPPELGLAVGSEAPDFRLPSLGTSEALSLSDLLDKTRNLGLLFVDPDCLACAAAVGSLAFSQDTNLILVSSGSEARNREKLGNRYPILLQSQREVAELYRATWSPSLQMIWPDGRVAAPLSVGTEAILKQAREMPSRVLDLGQIRDLRGRPVQREDLRERTLLLLWNPGCSWCEKMLPDLKLWRAGSARVGLILLVSRAWPELARVPADNVWVDERGQLARALGMEGTPSGLLLDGNGQVVSELAVGSDLIWGLVGESLS